MVSSCCGIMSLQKACIITGSIEIVMAVGFLLYDVVLLAEETPLAVQEREDAATISDQYRFHAMRVVLGGLNAFFWIGCLFLGFLLTLAAKQRDMRKLRAWYILTCIITVVFTVDILIEAFSMTAPIVAILSPAFGTVLQCYMIWIAVDFMDEISHGGCGAPIVPKSVDEDA